METKNINTIEIVNGVPMASAKFASKILISMIAHYRHALFHHFDDLTDYLFPEKIDTLYRERNQVSALVYPDGSNLSAKEQYAVNVAINNILEIMPEWAVYFAFPVLFKKMMKDEDMLSLTNHNIPQVIFLGEKAFKSETWLEEVIIHEMAHVWLGLLCEVDSFDEPNAQLKYKLPQGTKGEDACSMLFAAHSAACIMKFLERKRVGGHFSQQDEERLTRQKNYFSACVEQLIKMDELKAIGKDIVMTLHKEASKV